MQHATRLMRHLMLMRNAKERRKRELRRLRRLLMSAYSALEQTDAWGLRHAIAEELTRAPRA